MNAGCPVARGEGCVGVGAGAVRRNVDAGAALVGIGADHGVVFQVLDKRRWHSSSSGVTRRVRCDDRRTTHLVVIQAEGSLSGRSQPRSVKCDDTAGDVHGQRDRGGENGEFGGELHD